MEKLYYTIGEVSELTGVKPHVLRYWESEFPTLRPRKDRSGTRRYRKPDIEAILEIKQLLWEEGYKIAGARKLLRERQHEQRAQQPQLFSELDRDAQLAQLRAELGEIREMLRELSAEE